MHTTTTCESCGMPIEVGPYCVHCLDENGQLQAFSERLARMSQWVRRHEPELSAADAEARTLAYMSGMPAWREHPELKVRLAEIGRRGKG